MALAVASVAYPGATAALITHEESPPARLLPGTLRWFSATQWLLGLDWAHGVTAHRHPYSTTTG